MKKFLKIMIIFFILSIAIVSISFATSLEEIEMKEDQKEILNLLTTQTNNEIGIEKNTINSDLFITNDVILIENNVDGNAYLIGENIEVLSKEINGNLFVIGNNITIESNIKGAIYAIATNLNISGMVDDIYAISENLNISENTSCRDLKTIGTNIDIAGIINRDLYALTGQIEVSDTGKILGVLSTSDEVIGNIENINEIKKIEDINIGIKQREEELEKIGENIAKGIGMFFLISTEITGLIIIAIITAFTSKKKIQVSTFKENGLADTVYGLVYFALVIAIIIALMFTIIGIPVAILISIVLWFTFWKITIPVASIEITKAIFIKENKSKVFVWFAAFIIFTLVQCVNFIPAVGGLIKSIVSLYGFGYMFRNIVRKNKADDLEPEVEILG